MRRLTPLLLLVSAFGFTAADAAWAQQGGRRPPQTMRPEMPPPQMQPPEPPRSDLPRRQRDDSSLSDAVRQAQRANGGRVLGAEQVQSEGGEFTRIKIMDRQGRVRYIDGDRGPRSGEDRHRSSPEREAPVSP
jgi:hypothetical protein